MNEDRQTIIRDFKQVVNMNAKQLKDWLATADSQKVGQKKDSDESIGHQSGKRIVELLDRENSEYTDDELAHMKKVVSYVRRHSAQRPDGDIEHTKWRYSLMNWGHDPVAES